MVLIGFHGSMEPCRPGARFKQALGAMSSRRSVQTGHWSHVIPAGDGAVAWDLWLQGPSQMGFLLLCSASHRFLSNPLASAGMTWEADWKADWEDTFIKC